MNIHAVGPFFPSAPDHTCGESRPAPIATAPPRDGGVNPNNAADTKSNPTGVDCPTGYNVNGTNITGFKEEFFGDTWKPRISVGIGVNWKSPFGPFRIDIAKALVKRAGDDPKLFTFNVGTSF